MRLLTPETKFILTADSDTETVVSCLRNNLIGKKTFEIETGFGKKSVFYSGDIEYKSISFTRCIDSLFGIPIYPTSRITASSSDVDGTKIEVICSLSIGWVVFIYFAYIMLIFGVIFSLSIDASQSKIILTLKVLGSILVLNLVVFGYHFSELKNMRRIIEDSLKKCDELQSTL